MEDEDLGVKIIEALELSMFDLAKFIIKKQCNEIGADIENLSHDQALDLINRLDRMLTKVYGGDVTSKIIHKMKVVVANDAFKKGVNLPQEKMRSKK